MGMGMGMAYWRFWTRMKESTIGAVGARRASGDGLGNLVEVCAGDNAVFGDNGEIGLGAKPRCEHHRTNICLLFSRHLHLLPWNFLSSVLAV